MIILPPKIPKKVEGNRDDNEALRAENEALEEDNALELAAELAAKKEFKIHRKRQQLLLLRHASGCQHNDEKCPVTPICASMKNLVAHIEHCENKQCTERHCLYSRRVLSHYVNCIDNLCQICGPL
jgi:hypothetical protein